MTTINMLEAALAYIGQGLPVFPCCWPVNGKCGCGRGHTERDVGKAPITNHGLSDATITQLGVKEFWGRWPKANIGIAIPTGKFGLDVDILHNGFESLVKMQNAIGELPRTWLITTGTGGQHYWYKTTETIRNTVGLGGYEGLDIRGVGGYLMAPPSLHRNGHRYEVSPVWDGEITQAPQALVELCLKKQPPALATNGESAPIPEGQRNATLASLAGTMRKRGMAQEAITAALLEVNLRQCQPPLPDNDVRRIATSISRYAPGQLSPPGREVQCRGGAII